MAIPAIACIGIVGKNNKPLHISLFPPFLESRLKFLFLMNSCLDIFDLRSKHTSVDQDLGLLQALDERLAVYGWLTNTGVKLLIFVDLVGRNKAEEVRNGRSTAVTGIKDSDLRTAFRALQTAYVRLLQNPFYNPDDCDSSSKSMFPPKFSADVRNKKFVDEVDRIGRLWAPGVSSI